LEINASAAVGVELRHQAAQLIRGQIDVEAPENLSACEDDDMISVGADS
jgi:hypothetical protein